MRRLPSGPSLTGVSNPAKEDSFRRLVERQGPMLEAHCRQMLGTPHDAEDALQETLLRAWRGLPGYKGRSSLRSWLYRIATNVCIDTIGQRPERVLPIDHDPLGDPGREIADGAPAPPARYEQRETLERAFIAALEHLPARQGAVLILRDVLGFSATEVALILDTTVAATNSLLQRARTALDERLPAPTEQATLRSLEDPRTRDLVERLADAIEGGDIDAILTLAAA
jgi:RNA polymerase sigma-70 factor (ECF subfamily)